MCSVDTNGNAKGVWNEGSRAGSREKNSVPLFGRGLQDQIISHVCCCRAAHTSGDGARATQKERVVPADGPGLRRRNFPQWCPLEALLRHPCLLRRHHRLWPGVQMVLAQIIRDFMWTGHIPSLEHHMHCTTEQSSPFQLLLDDFNPFRTCAMTGGRQHCAGGGRYGKGSTARGSLRHSRGVAPPAPQGSQLFMRSMAFQACPSSLSSQAT